APRARPPTPPCSRSPATRRPSATVRPWVAATRAPSDSDPINAFRSQRNSPSWATAMARASPPTDTSTNSTTAAPCSAAGSRRCGSVKADLVEEPGDDLPQGVARDPPDQHHQRDGHGRDQDPAGHVAPLTPEPREPPEDGQVEPGHGEAPSISGRAGRVRTGLDRGRRG